MNKENLRQALGERNIDPKAYNLYGHAVEDTYTLRCQNSVWEVFFVERQEEKAKKYFQTEDEACDYFLKLVTSDVTTRKKYK
jgi:hypothetical protein